MDNMHNVAVSQSVSQSVSKSVGQSVSQSVRQSVSLRLSQSVSQSVNVLKMSNYRPDQCVLQRLTSPCSSTPSPGDEGGVGASSGLVALANTVDQALTEFSIDGKGCISK